MINGRPAAVTRLLAGLDLIDDSFRTLRRMIRDGMVRIDPRKEIVLTEAGRVAAEAIVRAITSFALYGFPECVVGDTRVVDAETGRRVRIEDVVEGRASLSHTLACDPDLKIRTRRVLAATASGSGKTTLIRMLTGTLEPTDGKLMVLGQVPRKFTRHAREKIGYMPQHFVLYEELTASENLSFVATC